MRFSVASTSSVVVATIVLGAFHAAAQDVGDPVTYTNGGVVYTAILDPDLDTVSDAPVSTIAPGDAGLGAGAGAGVDVLSTATNAAGDILTYSDGVPVGTSTAAPAAAPVAAAPTTTTTQQRGGVSRDDGQDEPLSRKTAHDLADAAGTSPSSGSSPSSVEFIHFQSPQRRSPTPLIPNPDQRFGNLEKRQAALGGGAGNGVQTTQTSLQVISGYNPPADTAAPSPTGYSSGVVLAPSDIPGYTGKENSQGVSSGAATKKINLYALTMGCVAGAAVFAFGL